MLTKKQCKGQRKISQESAFPPHGRMESCNVGVLLFRQYRGALGNWQNFGSANAWGKWTSTALSVRAMWQVRSMNQEPPSFMAGSVRQVYSIIDVPFWIPICFSGWEERKVSADTIPCGRAFLTGTPKPAGNENIASLPLPGVGCSSPMFTRLVGLVAQFLPIRTFNHKR